MRLLTVAFAAVCATGSAGAQVRFVNAMAPNNGSGLSWSSAYRSVQSALDAARADPTVHQIWVASGTYTPRRSSANRDESFVMVNGVAVLGGFAGVETSADQRNPAVNITVLSGDLSANDAANFSKRGDNSRHVVVGQDLASGALDGFTVRGGNWDRPGDLLSGGGGMHLFRCAFNVINCTFTDNIAGGVTSDLGGFGGGLFVQGGNVAVSACRFNANRGMNGGAMGIWGSLVDRTAIDCFVTLTDCDFSANFSPSQTGGAIWSATADPLNPEHGILGEIRATRCRFIGNHAEYFGAWTEMNATTFRLDDCDFQGDFSADVGGALGIAQTVGIASAALVRRSRFENNGFPAQRGAAVFAQARPSVFDSCTFADNKGTSIVHSQPVLGFSGGAKELELRNCVLQDNTGTAVFGFHNPSVTVINCTILRNPSTISGGGLAGGIETSAAVVQVSNTILWGNHRNGVHDQDAQLRVFNAAPQISHSILEGLEETTPGVGNLGLDPLLQAGIGPALSPGSPAIDTADNALLPQDTLDLDDDGNLVEPLPLDHAGSARRLDDAASADCRFSPGVCGAAPVADMGALEFISANCASDFNHDGFVTGEDFDLYVQAFVAGAAAADFNADGFVTGEDFDRFVQAFEAGC